MRLEVGRVQTWLSAGAVFVAALVVRAIAARAIPYPVPEDTAYYVDVAGNLVHGRGLVIDAIWSFQTPPFTLPRDAFEVWQPLPALLAALPMAVFGAGFRAAQVVSVLVGALLAVLAWRLAADVAEELELPSGRARTLAIGSGLTVGVVGVFVVYSALPDSTGLFAVLALASCLLMTRIVYGTDTGAGQPANRRLRLSLPVLGVLLGLTALARSEVVWVALAWVTIVLTERSTLRRRLTLLAVPALVAALVYLPWAVRDWIVFGQPLPGQTLANAFSISPVDIYAYRDQPTLARYLAAGPSELIQMRLTGTLHNIVNVLLLPALPTGAIGLVGLPLVFRLRAVRPVVLMSLFSFLAASLLFPVATTWGTYLHSSLVTAVLLVIATLVALDRLIAAVGRIRGWTRPVAWLGPALAIAIAVPLATVSVNAVKRSGEDVATRYSDLASLTVRVDALGPPTPVITDHPIWLARETGLPAIALPDEPPDVVLDLAHRFGARFVVLEDDGTRKWPGLLADGSKASQCFVEEPVDPAATPSPDTSGSTPADRGAANARLQKTRVFRIVCA